MKNIIIFFLFFGLCQITLSQEKKLNIIALSPTVIQLQGKFNLTRTIGDAFGFFTLNWIKVKNQWYIISDHTSSSN